MMPELALQYVFLCLGSGAGLGLLYVLLKVCRRLFGIGKFGTALLDIFFFTVVGFVLFLVALAADHGRLRFVQAALQLIGFLSVLLSVDPFADRISRSIYMKISGLAKKVRQKWQIKISKRKSFIRKRRSMSKKSSGRLKENKKGLEKLM